MNEHMSLIEKCKHYRNLGFDWYITLDHYTIIYNTDKHSYFVPICYEYPDTWESKQERLNELLGFVLKHCEKLLNK